MLLVGHFDISTAKYASAFFFTFSVIPGQAITMVGQVIQIRTSEQWLLKALPYETQVEAKQSQGKQNPIHCYIYKFGQETEPRQMRAIYWRMK